MPWEDKTVDQQRLEFVKRALAKEKTKTALCREYGISRPTGDKWIKRFEAGEDLTDQSRRPFHTPNRIAPEMEAIIVEKRKKYPAIGAKKLRKMMENEGIAQLPCTSTFNEVFQRNGLITKEASQKATHHIRYQKDAPNDMWQADFKGDYAMHDGNRCYPLSIVDDCSRFCLNADANEDMRLPGTRESFRRTFQTYGLPKILLCDNGVPWGSSQTTSITAFEAWMMELGILVIHIRARHPQTQGKVERFNGSFKQEYLKFHIPANLEDAQQQREQYRQFYNFERPHHALDLKVPASCYHSSERAYPEKIAEWEYETGSDVRKVKSSGYLTYGGQAYYLSEGLGGKTVALRPSQKDGIMNVIFREFRVAQIDTRENSIISRRIYLRYDDPRLDQNC